MKYRLFSFLIFFVIGCPINPNAPHSSREVSVPERVLLITEVGIELGDNTFSPWLEIYNGSTAEKELVDYQLRSYTLNPSNGSYQVQTFALPEKTLPSGGFIILRTAPYNSPSISREEVYIDSSQTSLPHIKTNGVFFFELLYTNTTIDFLKTHSNDFITPTTGQFSGHAPSWGPVTAENYTGKSISRKRAFFDNDAGTDWFLAAISTPGGPNDVTNDTDTDRDGIPDANEIPDSTFLASPSTSGGPARIQEIFLFT